ncbi:hypothetical protein [Shewanella seohaensis]|uniref:Uncharacterized protein n=1 Tax=Shewanella seohaensis TaxID=755175 RepID=A0ABV4VQS3_9GAMM
MKNGGMISRVIKITLATIFCYIVYLVVSSGVFFLMANFHIGKLSDEAGFEVYIFEYVGLVTSFAISSVALAILMINIKLKSIDSLFVASLLILFNELVIKANRHGLTDIVVIAIVTPLVVFSVYKYFSKNEFLP